MPEVIFPGPEGRLEGRFHPGSRPRAPVALILHSHPQAGGSMNNKVVQLLYQTFVRRGFATLRFNFRGVGKSQGVFDNGIGELSDAASALERLHDKARRCEKDADCAWIGDDYMPLAEGESLGDGCGWDRPIEAANAFETVARQRELVLARETTRLVCREHPAERPGCRKSQDSKHPQFTPRCVRNRCRSPQNHKGDLE